MVVKSVIGLLMLVFFAVGCCTTKYSVDSLPESRVVFGNGGGFAGSVNKYMLLDNGQILFSKSLKNDNFTEYCQCRHKGKKMYRKVSKINFKDNMISSPGNMYYFITRNDSTLVWGSDQPSDYIKDIYSGLIELVKESKEIEEDK